MTALAVLEISTRRLSIKAPNAVGSVAPVWRALSMEGSVGTWEVAALTASVMLLTKPWIVVVAAAMSAAEELEVRVAKVESLRGNKVSVVFIVFPFQKSGSILI